LTLQDVTNGTPRFGSPARHRLLAGIAPAAVLLAWTAGCQVTPPGPGRQGLLSNAAADLPNFGKVCEGLFRGGQPTDAGYEALRRKGVRTIVSLRTLGDRSDDLQEAGFRTFHISFKTVHPETEDVLEFLSIATNPDNRPLFVHCRRGADRTGMMIAVYRMVVQGWSRANAVREMNRMGFSPWNVAIEHYLEDLDVAALKRELARHVANDRPMSSS
jgi:protein tyrosine phosphatase (PTP) superfamily phosphohydrolase (DUF442 family)